MRKHTLVIMALAALLTLVLAAITTTSRAQDTQRTVSLSPGCNMVTLTFADGTDAAALTTAVSPSIALQTAWRLDNATGAWQAFMPQAPQASDLTSLNLLDAVFICVDTSASLSVPSASPDPAGTTFSDSLVTGCNAIGLSFPDGTSSSQVADAVTPPGAFQSIWRYDAAQGSFQAYMAAAPQASDLTSVRFLDAVYLCTTAPASMAMPALEGMPPPAPPTVPTATSSPSPQVSLTPIVFSGTDFAFVSDFRFHVDTFRFRVDWTVTLSTASGMFTLVVNTAGLEDFVCGPALADGEGVKSGTEQCSEGPGDFDLQVIGLFVGSWRVTITPLAD